MATSFGALCTDFYVNQKLAVKMDMPSDRETVLHFFDLVRKAVPAMNRFRRYDGELALESPRQDTSYRWLGMRQNSIRSGFVNPDSMEEAQAYHRMLLEIAPYHLTISPLDVDYVELMYGFDLECKSNHDEVVYEALYGDSPIGKMFQHTDMKVMDVQPMLGVSLNTSGNRQAYFEVKTRTRTRRGSGKPFREEPISLFLTLRQYGPVDHVQDLKTVFDDMAKQIETLATEQMIPTLLTPISRYITSESS